MRERVGAKGLFQNVASTDLELVRHVLLVEGIQAHEFETLGHHVERLVVGFGAQGHLVSANLQVGGQGGGDKQSEWVQSYHEEE